MAPKNQRGKRGRMRGLQNKNESVKENVRPPIVGQRPMSLEYYNRLKNICPILIKSIVDEGCELANILQGKRESKDASTDFAISEVELEEVRKETNMRERNYSLISAVLRRTNYSFECLREALIKTNHGHLVKYMNEGVVVGTRVETNHPGVETNHPGSDEILVKSFNEQLGLLSSEQLPSEDERPVREALRDLSNQNIPFVAAESGSIMLYTYCRTPDDIRTYVEMFRSRQLHLKISEIFERLFKMSKPQSLDTFQVKEVTITENYKEIIKQFTGKYDFSVADVDVGKPLGTNASQEDAISPRKGYSAADVSVDKSLGATILYEDANISSNDYKYSAADADVKRPFGTDDSEEDAIKTRNATCDIAYHNYHMPMLTGEGLFLTKHSATPFQNFHAPLDANPESMVAIMTQLCEPAKKRRQVISHAPPSTKIRKKELGTFSSWTEASNARKSLPKKSNQSPVKRLKGRIKPKKPTSKQNLLVKGLIKGKYAFPRSLSSTPHCKANDEPERGMTPRNCRSLSY